MKSSSVFRFWAPALLLGAASFAQVTPALGQAAASATRALLDKAHADEAQGRMDLAQQVWQQILLSDPNNTEALGGLARAAKLNGNTQLASMYLDRLRAINPNDPVIPKVESMESQRSNNAELQQAGRLAQQKQYGESMAAYRRLYGDKPPAGDIALAYYETEASTEEGRPHATAGLRALAAQFPNDVRYQVALGKILTYNPKTRAEGRRLLEAHPEDARATEAFRESLLWDPGTPATQAAIRAYLARHNDPELVEALRNAPRRGGGGGFALTREQRAARALDASRSAADRVAYRELNEKHIAEAEEHFKAILADHPDNPNALAGMGYIRMEQRLFGQAITFFLQARQDGSRDPALENALNTSRFWFTIGEGSLFLSQNDLPTAERNFRAALGMRPNSPEALEGLGGTLLKAQQPQAAIAVFYAYVKAKPDAPHAWRGLFLAESGAGDNARALQTEHAFPAAVRAALVKDPLFLRALASAYAAVGRDADSQRVLRAALELPFPADAKGMEADTQMQYASLLQQANRLEQAAGLYRQVLAKNQEDTAAWEGLVRVEHQMDQDGEALQTIESMPPASYARAMREPGFESTVASIYQSQKRYDVAQDILEKAIAQQRTTGQRPSLAVEIQLAGIYLQRDEAQQAYPLYRQILNQHPDSLDAWKGLLAAMHDSHRDGEALSEIRQIPAATRALLENDVAYLQTVGAIYNSLGQPQQASLFLRRVQEHYAYQRAVPPSDVDIQNAWLLYNAMNDAGLYRQLMAIGDRTDLTDTQRRTVQTIWANWAVRRANQAAAAGNDRRALAILNAAARSFPDNPGVIKALAAGYARAGNAKQAVLIWKAQDLNSAPAADYRAAVGAALAANDLKDAETWLRFGLDEYPKDAQMLILAAKFEESRGDTNRAADYYRASLDAMPAEDPGAELATELSHPGPVVPMRLPSASQPQDLAGLLGPGSPGSTNPDGLSPEMTPQSAPYLPGYGNFAGQAPVPVYGQGGQYDTLGEPGYAYPASPVVPSYMGAPRGSEMTPAGQPRLRDYVPQTGPQMGPAPGYGTQGGTQTGGPQTMLPQSSVPGSLGDGPVPMDGPVLADGTGRTHLHYASMDGASPMILTSAVYQQHAMVHLNRVLSPTMMLSDGMPQQSAPGTQPTQSSQDQNGQPQAPQQQPSGQRRITPAPTGTPSGGQAGGQTGAQTGSQTATPPVATPDGSDEYGPYVPYHPPAPVPVQLGNSGAQQPATKPEVTDVLPTARYVPNAKSRSTTSRHASESAAAAARRRQSQPEQPAGSATGTALTGQANPPEDDYNAAPTTPAQYTVGSRPQGTPIRQDQIPANQVPQPQGSPAGGYPAQNYPAQNYPSQNDQGYGQQYPQPNTPGELGNSGTTASGRRRRSRVNHPAAASAAAAAPAEKPAYQSLGYPGVGQSLSYQPYPLIGPAYPLGAAPSDADLYERRLPPLRGPYYTGETLVKPELSEREQAQRDLDMLEGSYSGWLGGTASARYRSGTIGLDRLTDFETSFEASATVGNNLRLSVIPKAVFLNSGQLATATSLNPVPLLGTLVGNAAVSPTNQFANGVGGEFQVSGRSFAAAVGYTPYEFLIRNVTGRGLFKPNNHVTFYFDRAPVEETQLSYAGLRDPGSATPVFSGNIWGGVMSTGGGVRFDNGGEKAGFYITADGADLSGYHVLENYKFEGSMGAYFLAKTFPGYGRLNIGAQAFGMHYNYNERGLTYGLGGYFSPEAYFLASVPITFTGRYHDNFHYTLAGAVGVQTFQEDNQIYFPLDRGLQNGVTCTNVQLATQSCGQMPSNSNTGGNYSINSEGAYRIADHWYAGGFVSANNTNNYNTVTGGFFVRYLFRPQYGTDDYPTGLFPVEGFRPLRVP
jgi:tetratricopeptide (TPR) repeat protein